MIKAKTGRDLVKSFTVLSRFLRLVASDLHMMYGPSPLDGDIIT
jgi:hypothetical protein